MPAAATAAPAAAPAAAAAPAEAPVSQILFASGKSDLDSQAQDAVKKAATTLAGQSGKVALSGFVDGTGNADQNAVLAKERAQAVAKLLVAQGVAEARIEMRKPQAITAGEGADSQARRVDILAAP